MASIMACTTARKDVSRHEFVITGNIKTAILHILTGEHAQLNALLN